MEWRKPWAPKHNMPDCSQVLGFVQLFCALAFCLMVGHTLGYNKIHSAV